MHDTLYTCNFLLLFPRYLWKTSCVLNLSQPETMSFPIAVLYASYFTVITIGNCPDAWISSFGAEQDGYAVENTGSRHSPFKERNVALSRGAIENYTLLASFCWSDHSLATSIVAMWLEAQCRSWCNRASLNSEMLVCCNPETASTGKSVDCCNVINAWADACPSNKSTLLATTSAGF